VDGLWERLIDQSVLAVAFLVVMGYFAKNFTMLINSIVKNLEKFGEYLNRVAETMNTIDVRMAHMEQRMDAFERRIQSGDRYWRGGGKT